MAIYIISVAYTCQAGNRIPTAVDNLMRFLFNPRQYILQQVDLHLLDFQ